jgi:hypothetical protein
LKDAQNRIHHAENSFASRFVKQQQYRIDDDDDDDNVQVKAL